MITDVLKGELGFAGFVGSDYNGCDQNGVNPARLPERRRRHVHDYRARAPRQFLTDDARRSSPARAQSRIDDAARRILLVKCEMGLLDGTQQLVDRALTAQVGSAAHRAVARRAVAASLVVLKNEGGVLPLAKDVTGIALGGKTGDNSATSAAAGR